MCTAEVLSSEGGVEAEEDLDNVDGTIGVFFNCTHLDCLCNDFELSLMLDTNVCLVRTVCGQANSARAKLGD